MRPQWNTVDPKFSPTSALTREDPETREDNPYDHRGRGWCASSIREGYLGSPATTGSRKTDTWTSPSESLKRKQPCSFLNFEILIYKPLEEYTYLFETLSLWHFVTASCSRRLTLGFPSHSPMPEFFCLVVSCQPAAISSKRKPIQCPP